MRAVAEGVKRGVKVKASGGVRTADDCIKMIQAGADRIGASAGVKIVQGMGEGGSSQETSGAGGY
jgi:deoxyribose-phosphate aldolase